MSAARGSGNTAVRDYVVQFGGAMAAYVIVLVAAIVALDANPHADWRIPVALAPVVPAIFALLAFVRFLGRMDELQRRIQLEAIGLSFGATGIVTFAYGFLQLVGIPAISWIWILPAMVMLWGLGLGVASWKYR
jgi:hypothetical protein